MFMFTVTNPMIYFISNQEILEGVELVRKYKAMAKETSDGTIMVTPEERAKIVRGVELWNGHCNDRGELVPRLFRMCGFVPTNIPIIGFMMLAPPTMFITALSQGINQSYNAGMNFGNKNSSCEYTDFDLLRGYGVALSSSIGVGLFMRKLLSPLAKGSTGNKALLLNSLVAVSGSASANFFNTLAMRYAEIE